MPWKKVLANVTGSIDEELLFRNEYLFHRRQYPAIQDQSSAMPKR